jgi:hypothetical protein
MRRARPVRIDARICAAATTITGITMTHTMNRVRMLIGNCFD